MCGIAGLVWAENYHPESLGRDMVAQLQHRGPDAQKWLELPNHRGVFAHTRLKIIDLSDRAAQPFVSDDGQVMLIFNGEIYNFKTLRCALERRGSQFRSHSDTEVILAQYLAHGIEGLHALEGMFALAIFNARTDTLLLMRDRLGKKPLYWMRTGPRGLLFASEPKAFRAFPGVDLQPDFERLPEYLTYGYISTPNSFLRGVYKLPPASRLLSQSGAAPHIERYWLLERPQLKFSLRETKAAIRRTIGQAVARRMISDVPLGAFLSGGIDSSIVAFEMASRSTQKVRTFAVGFRDEHSFDETPYAREVAQLLGTDHREILLEPPTADLFETLLAHHDEPYGDSSALAVRAVAEATKPFVSVALTGDGGDELFGGYTRFRGALMAGYIPPPATRILGTLGALLYRLPEPKGYKHPLALLRRFLAHAEKSVPEQLIAWNSYFVGTDLQKLLRTDIFGTVLPWSLLQNQLQIFARERQEGRDLLDQILRHNLETYLLDDLLVKLDRMTMSVGLEARSPLLDREVVELAFSLPSHWKIHFGSLKWILRKAYQYRLPASVLHRRKHGFGVPLGSWYKRQLAPMLQDLLLSPHAHIHQWLNPQALRMLVLEQQTQKRDHTQRIFALMQRELFLRRWPQKSQAKIHQAFGPICSQARSMAGG